MTRSQTSTTAVPSTASAPSSSAHPEKLGHAALLMFDLDNLKQINDTFGHDWGDEYIRRTGECFAKNAPARTVCARISSDEFNALFYGYNDQDTLRADIRALKAALEHSVVQLPSGRELRVSVSGGVAWYPESSTNLITLRKYADFAMYQVKHSRKGELLEFDPEVYRTSLQERRCHEEFRRLINEELVTYRFQPIIDAKDGSVFAYEALMRVDLPTLRSPMDVLRLAREENCLHEVERITFFCASSAYQALENAGKVVPSALLFINSIASQYLTPDELSEYSARYASILPRIVIEITEEECLDPKALRIKQTIPWQLWCVRARRLRQRLQQRAQPSRALAQLHQDRPFHHPQHRHRRQQAPDRVEHRVLRAPARHEGRG